MINAPLKRRNLWLILCAVGLHRWITVTNGNDRVGDPMTDYRLCPHCKLSQHRTVVFVYEKLKWIDGAPYRHSINRGDIPDGH